MALSTTCLAPGARAGESDDRETARALMDQGDRALARKDVRAALTAYQAADRIMRVPTTGLAVAKAQADLGLLTQARDTALRVARSPAAPGEPAVFAEARSEARQLAEAVAPRIASLVISVRRAPRGVQITLDGAALPVSLAGLPRRVNPGKHVVVARAPGHAPARADLTLAEGAEQAVALELRPLPEANVAGPAAEPRSRSVPTLCWIGFGVGAAGVAVGAVTGVLALSRASSARDQCDGNRCPPSAAADIDASDSLAWASNIAFGVGAIGIGVGVYGLVRVEPAVSGRFAGIRGSF